MGNCSQADEFTGSKGQSQGSRHAERGGKGKERKGQAHREKKRKKRKRNKKKKKEGENGISWVGTCWEGSRGAGGGEEVGTIKASYTSMELTKKE